MLSFHGIWWFIHLFVSPKYSQPLIRYQYLLFSIQILRISTLASNRFFSSTDMLIMLVHHPYIYEIFTLVIGPFQLVFSSSPMRNGIYIVADIESTVVWHGISSIRNILVGWIIWLSSSTSQICNTSVTRYRRGRAWELVKWIWRFKIALWTFVSWH